MQIQLPWKFCQGNFFNLSGFFASIAISVFAAKADGSEFMPDYEQVSNTIPTLKRTCKVDLKKSLPLFILQRRSRVLIFDRRQYHRCIDRIILIDMIMYMFSHTVNNISMKLVSRTKFEVANRGRLFLNTFGKPYDSLDKSASFKGIQSFSLPELSVLVIRSCICRSVFWLCRRNSLSCRISNYETERYCQRKTISHGKKTLKMTIILQQMI